MVSSNAKQIRTSFYIILSTCFTSTPIDVWNKYKDHMAKDILHHKRLRTSNANLQINEEMYNEALIVIEDIWLMLTNKGLIQLGMTTSNRPMHDIYPSVETRNPISLRGIKRNCSKKHSPFK